MEFEWDETKNNANMRKHGVSFRSATGVFLDPHRLELEDTRKRYGEQRVVTVGQIETRVFVVVYTWRYEVHRVISARKANERETKIYQAIRGSDE